MDDNIRISLLFDFYGNLLNEAQQRVVELYINEDLSLSETAELLKISRQGVRDNLQRAKEKLLSFEQKLGLYERFCKTQEGLQKIIDKSESLMSSIKDSKETKKELKDIKNIATSLIE